MRLLVTGGAGSLGSNLIEEVGLSCEAILVLDNFATGKRGALLPLPHMEVVEGSVTDAELVRQIFARFRPSHVVHSAASYKDPHDWATDAMVNIVGTINVLRASEDFGVKRFINFQTALCYGRPQQLPVSVDHPVAPFTSYGVSKTAGEAFVTKSSLSWASLRLANVTGPRLAIGPIPAFYKRLKSGEPCTVTTSVRDFLDMSDFLQLMNVVLSTDHTGVFNVATGEGHSIDEIFDVVARHLNKADIKPAAVVAPAPDDVEAMVLDPSKTHKTFKWRATTGFNETILRMLQWYDEHGVTDVYSHLKTSRP